MGIAVMVMGESGSGKSYSIKNMNPDEVGIFNVSNKPLPFKEGKNFKQAKKDQATYQKIIACLRSPKKKTYIIDDSQYLMVFEGFNRAKETGYGKFTDIALNFYNLVQAAIGAPDDVIVYFLHHTQLTNDGKTKAKTIGQMIDNQLTLEGLFSIVLLCEAGADGHQFRTQSDGYTTAKSPEGMFPDTIPNDLALVDKTIREYYGISNEKQEETNQ